MSTRKRQRLVRRRRAEASRARITARRKFIATGGALGVAATALVGAPAHAALPPLTTTLVADLTPGEASTDFDDLTTFGSSVFFTRRTPDLGRELWKSDGTAAGTALVKDIVPGPSSSDPEDLTVVGGTLFFTAEDPARGEELWKSDGTASGTVLVKDINPDTYTYGGVPYGDGSYPRDLTAVGNTLYFTADDNEHGRELWKSNGTSAGTTLVADGVVGSNSSSLQNLTAVGGTLFFTNWDSAAGYEIWSSDGSTMGRVFDVRPGSSSSDPRYLTAADDRLFFTANTGTGRTLFATDSGGTTTNLGGGSLYSYPSNLEAVGGTLFFRGAGPNGRELWKSDGTVAGTVEVADIRPGGSGGNPGQLTAVGGSLFFTAYDGADDAYSQLWRSDGTSAGTTKVASWDYLDYSYDYVEDLTDVGGTLFFSVDDGVNGVEVWRSDGTPAGTQGLLDTRPGWYGSDPDDFTAAGGTLYFTARDGVHGRELWRTATPASPAPTPPAPTPPAPTPAPPAPTTPADSAVDGVTVKVKGTQKQKAKVSIAATLGAAEAVSGKATGKIKLGKAKKTVKVGAKSIKIAAGGTAKLKLTVKKKDQAKVIKAVKKYRQAIKKASSKKAAKKVAKKLAVKATITVVLVDAAGNRKPVKYTVKLV